MYRKTVYSSIVFVLLCAFYSSGLSQSSIPGPVVICPQHNEDMHTHIGLSADVRIDRATGNPLAVSSFQVNYTDFPPQAQTAFQYAVTIWQSLLESSVPIRIATTWQPLGSQTLANAGATTLYRDFDNAPRTGVWYPVALAESLAGRELNGMAPDIQISVNSNINWYLGIDGNTPAGQFDLVTIILHELGHGLGFFSATDVVEDEGTWGDSDYPFIYDVFIENEAGQGLTNTAIFPNPSIVLGNQLISRKLFFNGLLSSQLAGGLPRIYAPPVFSRGASISHLDEQSYPAGSPNSLMTPQIGRAESIQTPGEMLMAMFADLGWRTVVPDAPPIAVRLFPNPVSDRLTIETRFRQTVREVSVGVYNLVGRQLLTGIVADGPTRLYSEEWDVSALPAGMYLIRINADGESATQKILVRR